MYTFQNICVLTVIGSSETVFLEVWYTPCRIFGGTVANRWRQHVKHTGLGSIHFHAFFSPWEWHNTNSKDSFWVHSSMEAQEDFDIK